MATAIATPFDDLLQKLIGSQTNTNVDEQLGVNNAIHGYTSGDQSTSQQQSSNQQQVGSQSQTQTSNADVSALQKVFAQQQAGITPEQLSAIFTEGAKAVPGLVATTANAVGARSGSNSPLATVLSTLNSNLTSQAAQINAQMLNDSSGTAAKIADLTKSLTSQGTTNQGTTGTVGITGSTVSTQDQNTNQVQNSTRASDTVQRSTINAKSAGLTAATALLGSLLTGKNAGDIGSFFTKLFGGSGGTGDLNFSDVFNGNFQLPSNLTGDVTSSPSFDYGNNNDIMPVFGGLGGFADGGLVDIPQLMLGGGKKQSTGPTDKQLLALGGGGEGSSGIGGVSFGSSGTSSSSGGSSGFSPVADGGGSTNAPGPGVGMGNPAIGNAVGSAIGKSLIGMVLGPILGPVAPLVSNIVMKMLTPVPTPTAAAATSGGSGGGNSSPSPVGSVSIGPATATDAETGAPVGISMDGPTTGTNSDTGDGGSGGDGGADGAGFADGGMLPKQKNDRKGIKDTMMVPMSGGEFVMPADVTAHPGMLPLLEMLRQSLHTPAGQQNARVQ